MSFSRLRAMLLSGAVLSLLLSFFAADARAEDLWANKVIDFSTQYDTDSWSAAQTLGEPDTNEYGDYATAWAPDNDNGTDEFITVGFAKALRANAVLIRETYGNGFVTKVDLLDTNDKLHTVWEDTDPSLPGSPENFLITFNQTAYQVKGVKVYVDTDHSDSYEEIDAIQLRGTAPSGSACGSGIGMVLVVPLGLAMLRFAGGRRQRPL